MDQRFESIDRRFEASTEQVTALSTKLDEVQAQLNSVTTQFKSAVSSADKGTTRTTSAHVHDYTAAVIELIVRKVDTVAKELEATEMRAELSALKIPALLKRAESAGVSEMELESADREEDYSAAVIELLVRKAGIQPIEEIRTELATLTVPQLLNRADSYGVSAQELEEVENTTSTDGQLIHGLMLEGCRWDSKAGALADSFPKQLFANMPVMLVKAVLADKAELKDSYGCPVYKTRMRPKGALGHPDGGYIFTAGLKTEEPPSKWVIAGVALLADISG
jgi:hypothetical protein